MGLTVDFYRKFLQVNNPDLRDAGLAVEGELNAAVFLGGGVGDLNEEEHDLGTGMTGAIEIGGGSEQEKNKHKHKKKNQKHKILHPQKPSAPGLSAEKSVKVFS